MAWNDQGGGFETSPSVDASPSVAKDRGYEEKNGLKPLCIKAIHRALVEDQFTGPDGAGIHQVTLLAKVVQSEMNNQRYDYHLADYTGAKLLAREYINDEDSMQPPELVSQGAYVRVYGTLKSFQGSPHVVIHRIERMKDPNEITMQLLEITHTYLKMKKIGSGGGESSAVDKTSDVGEQVRTVIQGNKSMTGLSVSEIKSALPHLTNEQITTAINYLSGEGFIFSTIDDDHFRATEDA